MSRLYCLDHPEILELGSAVADSRPGRVCLLQTPFYPGGGGQLPDRGHLRWSNGESVVRGFEYEDGKLWHLLENDAAVIGDGLVESNVDGSFRQLMRELHTGLHIVNALVYQRFNRALVTGVQMNEDGTARIDFDLQDADTDRLRELEPDINEAINQDLAVGQVFIAEDVVRSEPGLIRSRSVAPPPTDDGLIRIVEIAGLDRQACGGTHVASTGACRPVRLLKIDNKGRHNRRLRIGLLPA